MGSRRRPHPLPRTVAIFCLAVACLLAGAFVGWRRHEGGGPFRLSEPTATTIAALGKVKRPPTHPCDSLGDCYDYLGGWCQAPCSTYVVQGEVVSVRRVRDRGLPLYAIVLSDGDASIVARILRKPKAKPGARVSVSGVLFFPARERDGHHAANGAELSPVISQL